MKLNISKAIKGWFYRKYYVVLDGRANSVTISEAVYNHIMRYDRTDTDIFVFRISDSGRYAFAMRSDFEFLRNANTVFSQLQYNDEHHKIGFRSDIPSVTAICDDYNIPINRNIRLTVIPRRNRRGETFYEIQRPE